MHAKLLFKTLGLSMLVAVGAMAVSASAAQAEWSIKAGGSTVKSIEIEGGTSSAVLSVPGLELEISCPAGGIGAILETETASGGPTLTGGTSIGFGGCDVEGFKNACGVNSLGQEEGIIVASSGAEGVMEGSKTFATLESSEFTTVVISGALCPFSEVEETLSGSMALTFQNAETEQTVHDLELEDQELKFGEEEAFLEGEGGGPITGSATGASGNAWAIQLAGL